MTYSIEVRFKVFAKLRHGEDIRLVGNIPSLGCNDLSRAIVLVTTLKDYPWWWNKEAIFVPKNYENVRYRYAIFSGGQFIRFEEENNQFTRNLHLECIDSPTHATSDILDKDSRSTLETNEDNAHIQPIVTLSALDISCEHRKRIFCNTSQLHYCTPLPSYGVIIVSYYLPVIVLKDDDSQKWIVTWNPENFLSLRSSGLARISWVGIVLLPSSHTQEDEDSITTILLTMSCYPIFLPAETHRLFYNIFCKMHICPVLHHYYDQYGNIKIKNLNNQLEKDLWYACTTVNQLFNRKVVEIYQCRDLVWIHGYHLMLLPSYIRRKISDAKIGIFFHSPFPSSEIWKTLWCREDLLLGILCADQIGFHIYEYARHFMTTCRRVLGVHYEFSPSGSTIIHARGSDVHITCLHLGANNDFIENCLKRSDFLVQVSSLNEKYKDKIVITTIAKLERLKGLQFTLAGIELFLRTNPQYLAKISFVIIGFPAIEMGDEYHQTKCDVIALINHINHQFPDIISFEEKKLDLFDRLCLYAVSDILIVGGMRVGLSLHPMEYTYLKWIMSRYYPNSLLKCGTGVLIISEFVSSARPMCGALLVNPWKIEDIKNSLFQSLKMSNGDKFSRFEHNLHFCQKMTTIGWATSVLSDLQNIHYNTDDPHMATTLGFGTNYRIANVISGFLTLDIAKLCKSYRFANQRLLILNWGGTLVDSIENYEAYALATGSETSIRKITPQLKDILSTLARDERNHIFIISRQDTKVLTDYFGSIEGLGLAAEHGCYYLHPKLSVRCSQKRGWQSMISFDDRTWMDTVKRIMELFSQRTHGSYIEEKQSALIWQYQDADEEFGLLQSHELEEHLSDILSIHPLEVIHGYGYLEIRPAGLSKGLFLQHMLLLLKSRGVHINFLLTMGNDMTDEEMFEITNLSQTPINGISSCFSIAVGKQISSANYYVNTSDDAQQLLHALVRVSKLGRGYCSTSDFTLRSHHTNYQCEFGIQHFHETDKKRSHSISFSGDSLPPTESLVPTINSRIELEQIEYLKEDTFIPDIDESFGDQNDESEDGITI